MKKLIVVSSCRTCPYSEVIKTVPNHGKLWCNLTHKLITGTIGKPQEWCQLEGPSNTQLQSDINTGGFCKKCESLTVTECLNCGAMY